jgi:hypothetical protein
LKADELLLALRRGADHDQHAFGGRLHARLEIDAVSPDVDVAARREIAPAPSYSLSQAEVSRVITDGERFGASLPRSAASASWKSPVEMPRR